MSQAEPIEAAIQPIGFLVALSADWRICRVSANIGDYVGGSPEGLLGQPVTSLFNPAAIHSLRNRLALLRGPNAVERLFSIQLTDDAAPYDVAVHMSGTDALIEAEPSHDHHHHDRESTGTVRGMIAQLGETETAPAFYDDAARQLRALTGYDRVTIHRAAPDGVEQVVGEAQRGAAGSAMGRPSALAPEAAVPPALISLIADVDAAPVAVLPALDRHGRALDLSRAGLRAASPAETVSLRDVGVRAALTIALIVAGRPWGRIACHHRAPCRPSFERRSAVEYYAIMLAMQIEIRELKALLASSNPPLA